MPKEIETKFKIDSKRDLERRLKKIGAKFVSKTIERDTYYATPSGDFHSKTIRLRRSGREGTFTVKTPPRGKKSNTYKVLEEREIHINNVPKFSDMLHELGFKKCFRKEKIREMYKCRGTKIFVDTLPFLGSYVEIEASKKRIREIAKFLNLDIKKAIPHTYMEIFKCYKRSYKKPNLELIFRKGGT